MWHVTFHPWMVRLKNLTVQRELAQLLDTSVQFGIVSSIFSNEGIMYVNIYVTCMHIHTHDACENVYAHMHLNI